MGKTIINLDAKQAKDFFLLEDSYYNFDLPPYFKFDELICQVELFVKTKKLQDCIICKKQHPKYYEDVNYRLFGNKNGRYDWRKLQLVHPVIYVLLVNCLTD